MPVRFGDVLENFECESDIDNDDDCGDLNQMFCYTAFRLVRAIDQPTQVI